MSAPGFPAIEKTFKCPGSDATYSCRLGTEGCMEPFNPACCSVGGIKCPFKVTSPKDKHIIGHQKKTFTCPNGATYRCAAGSELGCMEPYNDACCGVGPGDCPFQVQPPAEVPPDFEFCTCTSVAACPMLVRACAANPGNPLCEEALPFCSRITQEADNRAEGYVSNVRNRQGQ